MKKYLFILMSLIVSTSIFSQRIVIENKQYEGINTVYPSEVFQTKFRATTKEINGKEYRELMYKVDDGWYEGVQKYYREEEEKVFCLYEGQERVILDFSLNVGDSILIVDEYDKEYTFFPILTRDTFILNKKLRKLDMRVQLENGEVSTVPHVWIEGVGDTGFFFGNGLVFGNQSATPLFCVRDNGVLYSAGMQCPEFLTSIQDVDEELLFKYDSSSRILHINSNESKNVSIYSITGARLANYELTESNLEINLNTFNQSICVLAFFDGIGVKSKILRI